MSASEKPTSRYHLSRPERLRTVTTGPRILCQTRIKNEARWINDVLDSMATVAHGIVVIDDGSTDQTPEICKSHPAVVEYIWQDHPVQDQVRDKDEALQLALRYEPEWILCLDGDEVLESSAAARILDAIATCAPAICTFEFNFLYMWNDMQHYRTDGPYTRVVHPRMFKVTGQNTSSLRYAPTEYAGNGHCKSVPGNLRGSSIEVDVNVLHLGYMYEEVRRERYERYRKRDPKQFATGYYEHLLDQPQMVIKSWKERPYISQHAADSGPRKQTLKADFYYANVRENLANLVPESARTILDVGCGQASLGGYLKSKRNLEVVGIEIQPEVAEVARERIDKVLVGDIEHMPLPYAMGYFDCIILADVLEHLINPWAALKKLTNYLAPEGVMIISLPNIRNIGIIRSLVEGAWDYQEWGILDSTHLRFFAKKNMEEMFKQAELQATLVETIRDPLFEEAMKQPPQTVQNIALGSLMLNAVTPEALNELTAQQFVFVASHAKKAEAPAPDVSIIIPVYNHVELTRQCVTSIFAHRGKYTFEVIIADDGSTDGTANYAKALGSAVSYTRSENNRGFAATCNSGAKRARGKYVIFLNNDTIVEAQWLDAMVEMIESSVQIGVVGNKQVFPDGVIQQAGNVIGASGNFYSIYHRVLNSEHPAVNKARQFAFVAGSCLLTPRTLFNDLGGFDEGYVNSYEDADYCMKVRDKGLQVWYCPQSRIQHLESQTVSGHAKSGPNHERFMQRWSAQMIPDDQSYYKEDGFDLNEMLTRHGRPTVTNAPTTLSSMTQEMNSETPARIAILTTWNQACGLAMYAQKMVEHLRTQGVTPLILGERTTELTGRDGDDVARCWQREQSDYSDLLNTFGKYEISLLHINHGGMFALEGWLTPFMREVRKRGIRIVTTFHSTESIADEFGERARLSDHIIVHHGQNDVELVALGGYPARTTVLPLPLGEIAQADLQDAKLELGLDPLLPIVSTVGFVDPHKGILELIEAIAEVRKELPVRLRVLGRPHPQSARAQSYLAECKAKAQELGIASHIEFCDRYLSDRELQAQLCASDVIVLNYRHARFEASAALMTALESGRPVITSSAPSLELELPCTFKLTEDFTLFRALDITLRNPFIGRVLNDYAKQLSALRSWEKAGAQLTTIYRSVLQAGPQADAELAKYYATHPDAIYAEPLQRERVRWLKQRAKGRILEIGPANGYVTAYTGASHAIDIYEGRLHVCRALRPGITFEYGDVVKGLKYDALQFDCVMAPEILEHVDFDEAIVALRECLRVGKQVLITVPSCDKPGYNPDLVHNPEHRWMVTREAVETLLREAGATAWIIDVSSSLEFYLIEATADKTQSQQTESKAAKQLRVTKRKWVESLRVAVDCSPLFEEGTLTRGIGRYTIEQFATLAKRFQDWEFLFLGPEQTRTRSLVETHLGVKNATTRVWADLRADEYDLLYLPHPLSMTTAPLLRLAASHEKPSACTFYDLIPALFPQAYLNPDPRYKQHYHMTLGMLREHCDLFLCISQCTAEDLRKMLGIGLERLRTIHAGVSNRFANIQTQAAENAVVQSLTRQGDPYVLFVGVPDARKNAVGMLLAVAAAGAASQKALKLVIAGSVPRDLQQLIKSYQGKYGMREDMVQFTGYVNDSDLAALYRNAHATLFPSLYEGFGFPIVEAMTAGCPVIAGANSSQPEVAGDAALLVNAQSVEEIAAAILKLWVDPELRARLIRDGYDRAQKFTWEKVADKTAMYLREFMTTQGRGEGLTHENTTDQLGVLETMS